MIVYKIINKLNNKIYIGKTHNSLRVRWLQHCKPRSHCSALNAAIQKYGVDNFTYEVIEEIDCPLVLSIKEQYYIKQLNSLAPNGYNLTTGGEGGKHSESTKQKLSELRKGSKNPMFGKKQSEETKAKRSASLKGHKRPQWVKDKIKANHNPKSDLNLTHNH